MKVVKEWFIAAWHCALAPYKMLLELIEETWFYNKIEDFFLEIKCFIQRGRRGWSDRDSWSIDWWLTEIMPSILQRLKETKHGVPASCLPKSAKNDVSDYHMKIARNRWDKKLDSIIQMFETARKIEMDHWIYSPTEDYFKKEQKDLRKRMSSLQFIKIMTYKECKAYEEGWTNFQTHFFSLWD